MEEIDTFRKIGTLSLANELKKVVWEEMEIADR